MENHFTGSDKRSSSHWRCFNSYIQILPLKQQIRSLQSWQTLCRSATTEIFSRTEILGKIKYLWAPFQHPAIFPSFQAVCHWATSGCNFSPIVIQLISHVQLFVISFTVACQALLSMGFFRQEYWNGLPFLSLGDLTGPGILQDQGSNPSLLRCRQILYLWATGGGPTQVLLLCKTLLDSSVLQAALFLDQEASDIIFTAPLSTGPQESGNSYCTWQCFPGDGTQGPQLHIGIHFFSGKVSLGNKIGNSKKFYLKIWSTNLAWTSSSSLHS